MLVGVGAVTASDDGAILIHHHGLAVDGPPVHCNVRLTGPFKSSDSA